MHAEDAYEFTHTLLRDAAYQVQLPHARQQLHGIALLALEAQAGGRPAMPTVDIRGDFTVSDHPTNQFASQLASHAGAARLDATAPAELLEIQSLYLCRAASLAEARHDHKSASQSWTTLAQLRPSELGAEAYRRAGVCEFNAGRVGRARTLIKSALDLARRCGNRPVEGRATGNLGTIHQNLGDFSSAEQFLLQAIEIHKSLGLAIHEGRGLMNLAVVYHAQGRYSDAEDHYLRAQDILESQDDQTGAGANLSNYAGLLHDTNRLDDAKQMYAKALATHKSIGSLRSEGIALGNLGLLHAAQGHPEEAEEHYLSAVAIHRSVGNRSHEGIALGNLATLNLANARLGRAQELFGQALDIHRDLGNSRFVALVLCDRLLLWVAKNQPDKALEDWERGASVLVAMGDRVSLRTKAQAMRDACAKAGIEAFEVPSHDRH